jgi:hypothetical protein
MAGITNISHSPADKRGTGLTFLGMQQKEVAGSGKDYSDDIDFLYERMHELRAEVKQLREYVMTPWYKKLWKAVKRIFRNGDL